MSESKNATAASGEISPDGEVTEREKMYEYEASIEDVSDDADDSCASGECTAAEPNAADGVKSFGGRLLELFLAVAPTVLGLYSMSKRGGKKTHSAVAYAVTVVGAGIIYFASYIAAGILVFAVLTLGVMAAKRVFS